MKRLLIVDDDFVEYDTLTSLENAISKAKSSGYLWSYSQFSQEDARKIKNHEEYDAIFVDNDFGEGIVTISNLFDNPKKSKPAAYISAYDLSGLIMQQGRLNFDNYNVKHIINPLEFENLGIKLMQKRGKNISKDITIEDLENQIYEFLIEDY